MARVGVAVPTNEPSPFNPQHAPDGRNKRRVIARRVAEEDQEEEEGSEDDTEASNASDESEGNYRKVLRGVREDMAKFEDSFRDVAKQYRLIDRIGEGTFSTVYKAEDLLYDQYLNDWDLDSGSTAWVSPPVKRGGEALHSKRPRYVAIKKIYVTSSPMRIQNELELLNDLRLCKDICPLITAFRHHDQVIAVLPYYHHQDFRDYFRNMLPHDMQAYLRSLFSALAAVHKEGILHRDIKPTNFLYDYKKERGVLVDFGLAEREGTDSSYCICVESSSRRRSKVETSWAAKNAPLGGYPKNDTRASRRANRAGTRGFRAPEVLFKCTSQTTKIDVWSAGVILLTMLSHRFPFFNSADDVDAMVEVASIFGKRRMQACALLHGEIFDSTIPTIGERGFPFEKLIRWSTCRTNEREYELSAGEKLTIKFLERCMELDPKKRISAREALEHEFLAEETNLLADEDEEMEDELDVIE